MENIHTTETVDIRRALSDAIEHSGRLKKDVALSAGITPQNLANLINDKTRNIPLAVLQRLVIELDDLDLKWAASDWTFQIGLAKSGEAVLPIPLAVKEDVDDEQDDREQLDKQARRIFKRPPNSWESEEIQFVQRYYKELNEEVSAEQHYLDVIADSLKQVLREVI